MSRGELPPIRKTVFYRAFRSGRRECWEAETVDGTWVFVREESPGTPWLVRRRADGEIVAMAGSLDRARRAAEKATKMSRDDREECPLCVQACRSVDAEPDTDADEADPEGGTLWRCGVCHCRFRTLDDERVEVLDLGDRGGW